MAYVPAGCLIWWAVWQQRYILAQPHGRNESVRDECYATAACVVLAGGLCVVGTVMLFDGAITTIFVLIELATAVVFLAWADWLAGLARRF